MVCVYTDQVKKSCDEQDFFVINTIHSEFHLNSCRQTYYFIV
jgi:hypothetical protein